MDFSGSPMALAQAGDEVRVCAVRGGGCQRQRLRELGLIEGKTVRIVANGGSMICQIGDCRFGLCRRLAYYVMVESASAGVGARSAQGHTCSVLVG